MLYDSTTITTPSPNDNYEVPGGQMIVFPFTLEAGQALRIESQHTMQGTQDHSLRVWVSDEIDGRSLSRKPDSNYWHPNRTPGENVIVYDSTLGEPTGPSIPAIPGDYYVNVLNLANSHNALLFRLTDLG